MLHPSHDPRDESRAAFLPTDRSVQGGPAVADETLSVFKEGQVLDNTYRIVRMIGEGGMGVVFEAKHARLAGRYAIKVLLRRFSENPEAMARFDREARITSSLQHPNIVQVIDFNRLPDGSEYLVMEYLQGETLGARLLRMGSLPVEIVAGIVEQIAAGLAAAHSHGVVHRDLKPENVFLVPVEGRHGEVAKVLDFGISKLNDAPRRFIGPESGLMGTPQFMSPEQCRGRPAVVDAASDQFSLAALTYQMLTGRTPFSGDNVGAVLWHVLYDNPLPMGIETEVERVVIRGLSKAKEGRFPSVTAFAEALCAAAAGRLDMTGPVSAGLTPARIAPVDLGVVPSFDGHERASGRGWRSWSVAMFVGAAIGVSAFFVAENMARSVFPLGQPRPARSLPEVPQAVEIRPEIGKIVRKAAATLPENPSPRPPPAWPVNVTSAEARSAEVRPAKTRATKVPSPKASATIRRRESAARAVGSRLLEKPVPASSQRIPLDGNAVLPLDETFGDQP